MAEGWQGIRISFLSHARYLVPLRKIVAEAAELAGLAEEVLVGDEAVLHDRLTNVH